MGKGVKCKQIHSKLLHGCTIQYVIANKANVHGTKLNKEITVPNNEYLSVVDDPHIPGGGTVMLLQTIQSGDSIYDVLVQFDTGCNKSLVTHSFANKNNLQSIPTMYYIKTVGNDWEHRDGCSYMITLTDRFGNKHYIHAFGVDSIGECMEVPDLSTVRELFPDVPDSTFLPQREKEIDVLLGLNQFGLFPTLSDDKYRVGNLQALSSLFGSGFCIAGSHPKIKSFKVDISPSVSAFLNIAKLEIQHKKEPDLFQMDQMILQPTYRCQDCHNCTCSHDNSDKMSPQQLSEKKRFDDSVTISGGKTLVSFPLVKDPSILKDNRCNIFKRSEAMWNNLNKNSLLDRYNEAFKELIDKGAVVEISREELEAWPGVKNYVSHHAVVQPSKPTTPVRVVTNSSQKNNGSSLNECCLAGPNQLADIFKLLIGFRMVEHAFSYDLSKAY